MNRMIDRCCRLLEGMMALALAIMVVMVFGNVVLRYLFNSGITVSEEVSRWLFVWLTFTGAIVAMRERSHLGTDMLVSRLGKNGKRFCLALGQVGMLYVVWLLLTGSYVQMQINADTTAPATGASMAIFYASGVFFAVPAAGLLLLDLWRTVTGRIAENELVLVQESEDLAHIGALPGAPGTGPADDGHHAAEAAAAVRR